MSCNVYIWYISIFSIIVRPLNSILNKDAELKSFSPLEEQLNFFRELERCLENPPVFGLPKKGSRHMIYTDARKY